MNIHHLILAASVLFLAGCSKNVGIEPVGFEKVRIQDEFWSPWLQRHKDVTIGVCIDQIENKTDRIRNFENAALRSGEHSGIFYDDSDAYKALEGFAYSLQNNPDPVLEAKCDEWIDKFAAAQEEDGYLNTYYTLTGLDQRWTDYSRHEMYLAGHLIEAAVAYYNVTGKRKLLEVSEKMVAHMMNEFGPEKRDWLPGHEEIELALVKLFRTTGKREYLDFAYWLLEERGHGLTAGNNPKRNPEYWQDNLPVREMRSITGHAVRAMYLYCAVADVASYTGDAGYMEAMDSLWVDVVERNMYITGGIGQSKTNEGFTRDWSLPNKEAYCETCASAGMVFWNWRMNTLTGDSKYVDVLERSLYNGLLSGISLSGDKFFYVNPLESDGDHHRKAWYGTACCPSQICRFLPSIGNYIYSTSGKDIYVNLYMGNTVTMDDGRSSLTLTQNTRYPWEGKVDITIGCKRSLNRRLMVRIPGWCREYSLKVNGKAIECPVEKGYAAVDRKWKNGDCISFEMAMPVEVVAANPRVKEDEGLRAIQRGPIVYCLEEIDNPGYDRAVLTSSTVFDSSFREDLLGGVEEIVTSDSLRFIPYYSWDNREASRMKIWVQYSTE